MSMARLDLSAQSSQYICVVRTPAGPWARLLDAGRILDLPVQLPDARGQRRQRAAGSVRAVAERLRAERAAVGAGAGTLGTLGATLGASLSATASLSSRLSASQYSLGAALGKSARHICSA